MNTRDQLSPHTRSAETDGELTSCRGETKVAASIPELGNMDNVDPDQFGIHLTTLAVPRIQIAIQSFSKAFSWRSPAAAG